LDQAIVGKVRRELAQLVGLDPAEEAYAPIRNMDGPAAYAIDHMLTAVI
jgi:hypothetical protein